jgi:hypothetical protein
MAVEMLSVMSAIRSGHEQPVRAALDDFKGYEASPFAQVPGTHGGRFVVLNALGTGDPTSRKRLRPTRLLFSAVIDGPADAWLWGLFEKQGSAFEEVWHHCVGWPERTDSTARACWLLDQRLPITHAIVGNDATVAEIRRGLALRDALRDVASEPADRPPAELRAVYCRAMAVAGR